jgi:peptidoglycan/LPS O-acetylase OafA/YrhL
MLSWHARGDGAGRFYIRRLFRIAPMFWAALIVYSLLFAAGLYPEGSTHWSDIALTAVFLHGFSPNAINLVVPGGWTIGVEMMFYAMFPLIAAVVTTPSRALAFVVLSILLAGAANSLLLRALSGMPWSELNFFSYYWFPENLQSFAFGCLAFHLLPFARRLSRFPWVFWVISGAGLALALIAAWANVPWYSTLDALWSHAVLTSLASLALAMALAIHSPRWLVNPVTRYIGTVSYSAYLVHFLLFAQVLAREGPFHIGPVSSVAAFAVTLVVVIPASVGLATLTWRGIEQPGIALGNRLIARLSGPVAVQVSNTSRP